MPWINKNGLLQERVIDPHTGLTKVVSVKISGKGEKAHQEAYKRLQDKIAKMSESRFLFSTVLEVYFTECERSLKPSSVTRLDSNFKQIKKIIGEAYLDELSAGFIRMKLLNSGKSNRTINDYQESLKTFWRWAYRNDFVKSQEVADKLTPFKDQPRKERIQDKYLEPWEAKKLLEAIEDERYRLLSEFLLLSGMRVSEAIALENTDVWGDIIKVSKTYDHINKVITSPKSVKSRREIHVQPELKECIEKIRRFISVQKKTFDQETPLFLPDIDGGYLNYLRYNKYIGRTSEAVLNRRVGAHHFRHTHCSFLVSKGLSYEAIACRLGHEDSKITKDIYTHRLKELRDKENKQIDTLRLFG